MPEPLDPLLRPDFTPLFSFNAQISPDHRLERFHVLQSGDSFFLRLHNHPDWLAIYDDPNAQLLAMSRGGDTHHFEFSLQDRLTTRGWGRVLSLLDPRGNNRLWRVTWMGKRSFLMRVDSGESVDFSSNDEWKRGAWIQPGAHFQKRLAREWNQPASDIRQALAFLEADDEARRLWGLEWQRGSWPEMKRVLRAAATIEHEFGDRTVVQSRTVSSLGARPTGFGSNAPQSPRLLRLIERLELEHVAVLPDKSKLRRFAPRPFAFQVGAASWPELRVGIDPPSEHEKLEARLELHEWLCTHAPDLAGEWS